MKQVTWDDLQYARENEFYNKLSGVLTRLQRDYEDFSRKTQQLEKEFLKHLAHSVRINKLPRVSTLLQKLNDRLNTEATINVFLCQAPISNAVSIPRYSIRENAKKGELVILVSQHFMNDLDPIEQLSILGHELGHLLYGHVHIPAKAILDTEFRLGDIQSLKSDVLKWMICAEVSCDIIGYLSCGCSNEAFSLAMLKYITGLTSATILKDGQQENLINLMSEQFEELSKASSGTVMTTHPFTPLRLRIVNAISHSSLLESFGKLLREEDLAAQKTEFNALIDAEVERIYPDIVRTGSASPDDIVFRLCIAVAVADGDISKEEILAIGKIIGSETDVDKTYLEIHNKITTSPVSEVVNDLVDKAGHEIKRRNYNMANILGIVRSMLVVAASDGRIEASERETILRFSKPFGITGQELEFLIARRGLH